MHVVFAAHFWGQKNDDEPLRTNLSFIGSQIALGFPNDLEAKAFTGRF
jgi:hypothetical protein